MRPDGAAVVTLAPPRGALSAEVVAGLLEIVDALRVDKSARAVVLASANSSVFAVSDVGELRGLQTSADGVSLFHARQALADAISSTPKPFVAAVHGRADGLGFELALACDARLVDDDVATAFALGDVRRGVTPSMDGVMRLAGLVGFDHALEISMSGRDLDAHEATRLGISSAVVPAGQLLESASALGLALARRGRPKREWLPKRASVFAGTVVAKGLAVKRARDLLATRFGRDALAEARLVELFVALVLRGVNATRLLSEQAFGELVVSSGARARMHFEEAIDSICRENDSAKAALRLRHRRTAFEGWEAEFSRRVARRFADEASLLLAEGSSSEHVDGCLVEWGFDVGPLAWLDEIGLDRAAATANRQSSAPVPREEVQMRCVLRLVNEAMHCLGDGVLKSARHGDVASVVGLGFPSFRGGVLHYVERVGPSEVLARIEVYHRRYGDRFAPAAFLVDLAHGRATLPR